MSDTFNKINNGDFGLFGLPKYETKVASENEGTIDAQQSLAAIREAEKAELQIPMEPEVCDVLDSESFDPIANYYESEEFYKATE